MKYNKHSLFSLEAIDYQKNDWFIPEHNLIVEKYQKGELDPAAWKEAFAKLVKKRFNLNCYIEIDDEDEDNAAYWTVFLDDAQVIAGYESLARYYVKFIKKEAKPLVTRIAKGDLSPLGLLDHKKVRAGGLFSQITIKFTITEGCLKQDPNEVTATMLHEIGHAWTFFEYVGATSFRNAIITNNVVEYLGAKNTDERTQIIIAQSNVWGLEVDKEKLTKLNDTNAAQVIIGAYNRVFTEDTGYVQYNNNTAEAVADQFMSRFGMGRHLVKNLSRNDYLEKYARFSNVKFFMSGVKLIIDIATITGVFATSGFIVTINIPVMITGFILSYVFGFSSLDMIREPLKAKFINGFTYDETRDRFKRIYNETIGYLKDSKIPKDIARQVIADLDYMAGIIENKKKYQSIPLSIIRWLSADFRSQESKKLYQQMIEDLLSNELYVTAARLRDLK